ncbi:MAG: hypothetical protein ABIR70_19415 [Bryobacteraceae bacterium]
MRMRAAGTRRLVGQRGTQIMEFGLVAILFIPMFMGTFVTGMNVIRSIQANHTAADLANMYIHGAEFSDPAMQRLAKRLAAGLGLEVGSQTTNMADNLSNSGRGIVWVSKLQWIGNSASASCVAVSPAACTNANKFVFLEQIQFGNGTLRTTDRDSSVGHPGAARDIYGAVTVDKVLTANAAVPEPYQTTFNQLWQVTNTTTNRTALADQQIVYMVEVYFKSPDLSLGALRGNGVYARWFY